MKAMTFPFWRPCWPPLLNTTSPVRKAASWLAAVYLLGMAMGALAGQQIVIHVHASTPLTAQARRAHFVENLARDVSLTHVQRQSVDRILQDASVQFEVIHRQTDARINSLRMQGRAEVRAILTPDQRTKFDEWLRGLDENRDRNNRQTEHK